MAYHVVKEIMKNFNDKEGLEPAEHTIEFTGGISGVFETSVTYHLTIEPRQESSSLGQESPLEQDSIPRDDSIADSILSGIFGVR